MILVRTAPAIRATTRLRFNKLFIRGRYMHPTVSFIRNTLRHRKISYQKLSEDTGLDISMLKRVLSGRQQMTLNVRDIILSHLDIVEPQKNGSEASAAEIASMLNSVPKHLRVTITTLIRDIANHAK